MKSLPNYLEFETFDGTPFKQLFSAASDEAIDLLSKMLKFNPFERISASEALQHDYFTKGDKPTGKMELPFPQNVEKKQMQETTKRKRSPEEDSNRNVKRKLNLISPKD
jgi:cyclin-dependent kinase 7